VPKLVTVWREQDIQTQARHYVRAYILFPSGILGLVCMIGGIGSLGYQLFASSSYTWITFMTSSGLLLIGALCGFAQTKYHRFILESRPEVFAARMRSAVQRTQKKAKEVIKIPEITHPGRRWVPVAYIAGSVALLGGSIWAIMFGAMDALPALLMPWAGFYWGKLFFWRGIIK
jgi:hypothetical protein